MPAAGGDGKGLRLGEPVSSFGDGRVRGGDCDSVSDNGIGGIGGAESKECKEQARQYAEDVRLKLGDCEELRN